MRLTVATWNVEHARGAEKNAERQRLLLTAAADVVVLTETHDQLVLPGYVPFCSTAQAEARPGSRWTTVWTKLAGGLQVETQDPSRTVCVAFDEVLVYGTVLPWHADRSSPEQRNWDRFREVVAQQGEEWRRLRADHPDHHLVVAGDWNQSLTAVHHYGGKALRAQLKEQCAEAGLQILTQDAHTGIGLAHPLIDHIAVAPARGATVARARTGGWPGNWEGPGRLSDHPGVSVSVELASGT